MRHLAPGPVPAQCCTWCVSQCCTWCVMLYRCVASVVGPGGSPGAVPGSSPQCWFPSTSPRCSSQQFSQCWPSASRFRSPVLAPIGSPPPVPVLLPNRPGSTPPLVPVTPPGAAPVLALLPAPARRYAQHWSAPTRVLIWSPQRLSEFGTAPLPLRLPAPVLSVSPVLVPGSLAKCSPSFDSCSQCFSEVLLPVLNLKLDWCQLAQRCSVNAAGGSPSQLSLTHTGLSPALRRERLPVKHL
jgi:hypothetical protein